MKFQKNFTKDFLGKNIFFDFPKICTLEVHNKIMCVEFSDFAQNMWKKIRFKFEMSEKFYKGFPWKKNFPRESFVK